MRLTAKAAAALAATFVLGVALGVFATAEAFRPRDAGPAHATAPDAVPRFVREMEDYLQPRDAAQRATLRPLLLHADSLNRATVEQARRAMRDILLQLRERAAPVLDSVQRQRLDRFITERGDPDGRHPPRGLPPGGPPDGPPPDGAAPRP